jgi:6-phosphofructokinase 1
VDTINQKLGYLVRGSDPDAIDSIVPWSKATWGWTCCCTASTAAWWYSTTAATTTCPIDCVTGNKNVVNFGAHYNTERLRPFYKNFHMRPLFIMTSE